MRCSARGLHEGPGNTHPGQGTVNRRFFFRNALSRAPVGRGLRRGAGAAKRAGTRLWERWINRAQRRLSVRPGVPARDRAARPRRFLPGRTSPRYFPAGFSIEVALDIPPNEPLLFYLPFARPALVEDVAPIAGGVQIGPITGTTMHLPDTAVFRRH